uniref:Uncharacterized protein n=1 Tax=Paulinella longichromatophora TaxID=1708747 RepID=A0A2H4ZQ89_9EUKA|nr:hypothetical protein PLO_714 [Paulinella longichromatophora]
MVFPLSPLIRATLVLLYIATVLPLPVMAPNQLRFEIVLLLLIGILLIWSLLSEQITIDRLKIRRSYPAWCLWFSSNQWEVNWNDIQKITPVQSSQGGWVYYIISKHNKAHLLPQRIARFNEFINQFKQLSGIEFLSVSQLTPPWTYQLLRALSCLIIAAELLTFFLIRFIFI